MKIYRFCLFIAVLVISANASAATAKADRKPVRIHVLTMEQGDDLFGRFGHIALMVEDRVAKTKEVYNFGTFDFTDSNLRLTYLKGYLNYWLSVWSYRMTLAVYEGFDRTTVLRTLDLTAEQATEVARRLEINARPENATYAYRHYLDNCCTRIRDLLDDVTGGALSEGRDADFTDRTFRDWTRKCLKGLPASSTVILFILGPQVDHPITRYQEQFLPEVVAEDLDKTRVGSDNRPLVLKKRTVLKRRGEPVGRHIPTLELAVAGGFWGLLAVGFLLPLALGKRRVAAHLTGLGLVVWALVAGLGGSVLLFLWTYTTHFDTHYNENLLVMPPLHLWLVVPGVKLLIGGRLKPFTARRVAGYLLFALGIIGVDIILKLGPFTQSNWGFIGFGIAVNALALAALKRSVSPD